MNKNTAFVIVLVMAVLVALVVWVRHDFGEIWAAATAFVLVFIISNHAESLKTLMTMRATMNTIVDFQAADDRGEVARSRMLTEVIKGASKVEVEDRKQANWFERLTQKQLPAPTQAIPVWDDTDANTVDAHGFIISD